MKTNPLVYFTSIFLAISSCSQGEPVEAEKTTLSSKLEVQSIERASFKTSLDLLGKVQVSPSEKLEVTIPLGGKIISFNKIAGDIVKQGELLCYFENPQYLEIQKNYLHLQNQLRFENLNLGRLKQLPVGQSISKKELEEAEFKVNNIEIQLASVKKEIEFIGHQPQNVKAETLKSRIPFLAPFSGKITNIQCTNGSVLDPESKAFQIIGTSKIYALLNAYNKDLQQIKVGLPIAISSLENDASTDLGTVSSIDANLNENGTCLISAKLNSHNFIDGQPIKGKVNTKNTECFKLPKSSVIEYQGKYYIVLLKENKYYNTEVNYLGEVEEYSFFKITNPDLVKYQVLKSNAYGIFMKNL